MNVRREVSLAIAILLLAAALAGVARGTAMHTARIAATQQRVLSLALSGEQTS